MVIFQILKNKMTTNMLFSLLSQQEVVTGWVPERCSHEQAGGVGQATSGVSYGSAGSLPPLHGDLQPPPAAAKSLPLL